MSRGREAREEVLWGFRVEREWLEAKGLKYRLKMHRGYFRDGKFRTRGTNLYVAAKPGVAALS